MFDVDQWTTSTRTSGNLPTRLAARAGSPSRRNFLAASPSDRAISGSLLAPTNFTSTVWWYYDSDENPVRYREHVTNQTQTWSANGRVLTATGGGYLNEWNASDPFVSVFSGKPPVITVPGEGVVFLDAGRVELNVLLFEVMVIGGRHDLYLGPFIGAPYPEPFCDYLAG